MQKDALISTNASILMAGRNRNIIQTSLRLKNASTVRDALNHTAHTTILSTIAKYRWTRSSDISQRVVNRVSHQTSTYLVMVLKKI